MIDLSIPVEFFGNQVNAFGMPKAKSEACRAGDFIGDTREGGSCNCESFQYIPHCNGTHTEGIGHITEKRISIQTILPIPLLPCILISVTPEKAKDTKERCSSKTQGKDKVITKYSLIQEWNKQKQNNVSAMVIRTLPNPVEKKWRSYLKTMPPYFSCDAMQWISEIGIDHLIVDLPSVDRLDDNGELRAHRIFWKIPEGKKEASATSALKKSITELAYVPDKAADGMYMLNLQVMNIEMDCAPSRPILFPYAKGEV